MAKKGKGSAAPRAAVLGPTKQTMERLPFALVETMAAGIHNHRDLAECLLDAMLLSGKLGDGRNAKRRHEAGLWLRALFHKAGLTESVTGSYGQGGRDDAPIADHVAWNRKCLNDTLRALTGHSETLQAVCCHDEPRRPSVVCAALNALANHRGF